MKSLFALFVFCVVLGCSESESPSAPVVVEEVAVEEVPTIRLVVYEDEICIEASDREGLVCVENYGAGKIATGTSKMNAAYIGELISENSLQETYEKIVGMLFAQGDEDAYTTAIFYTLDYLRLSRADVALLPERPLE